MADANASSETKRPTVVASAKQCLQSFEQCLFKASAVHPRELSLVEDQAAAFSTWSTGIDIFTPAPACVDHKLRYAPEVQSVVTGLLESLNCRIRTCSGVLDVLRRFRETNAPNAPTDALERSLGDVATEINHLHKISKIIRRAGDEVQILKASDFRIKTDDGKDVEPALLGHFERHIRQQFPNISDTLQQRLARTMLLRRKLILYRRQLHRNATPPSQKAASKASGTLPTSPTVPPTQGDVKSDDSEISPSLMKSILENFKLATSTPSISSESDIAALGDPEALNFPPTPGLAAKQKYEQFKSEELRVQQGVLTEPNATMDTRTASALGQDVAYMVEEDTLPAKPNFASSLKSALCAIGDFTCPYCLDPLSTEEVFEKSKWQDHVKNDLDPYVCLFEQCDQPDELFNHSDGWLRHLHEHSRCWRCSSHRELGPFLTREEYVQHMREAHSTKLSDTQLRVLATRNTCKTTRLFQSCPLCGKDEAEVIDCLEDHIARHLSSLALKSLPRYQNEVPDDAASEKDSVDETRSQTKHTAIRDISKYPSIWFEDLDEPPDASEEDEKCRHDPSCVPVQASRFAAASPPDRGYHGSSLVTEKSEKASKDVPQSGPVTPCENPFALVTKRGRARAEDEPPNTAKKMRLSDVSGQNNTRQWACPFYFYDRRQYRPCLQRKLSRVSDVRRHIGRQHLQVSHCPICGYTFPKDPQGTLRSAHLLQWSCRPQGGDFSYPGVTQDQWHEIASRASGRRPQTDEQRWFEIWDIVFPELTQPESPFVLSETAQMIMEYSMQFSEEGHINLLVDEVLGRNCGDESRQLFSDNCHRIIGRLVKYVQQQEQEQEQDSVPQWQHSTSRQSEAKTVGMLQAPTPSLAESSTTSFTPHTSRAPYNPDCLDY